MKKACLLTLALLTLGLLKAEGVFAQEAHGEKILEGEVIKILDEETLSQDGNKWQYQKLLVDVYQGELEGEQIVVENGQVQLANDRVYKPGDKLVISYLKGPTGEDLFYIADYVRRQGLSILFLLFAVLAVAVGSIWGARSLIGMIFSFIVIFKFILPQIISGNDAVLVAIFGSAIIIPVTFILSHGKNKKTYVAIISTIITLTITGLLAKYAVDLTHLTGFAAEEAGFLQSVAGNTINMKGVLLAGIIIASLGILDDITISQASIVYELNKVNKNLGFEELFKRAMNVGRDHVSSLINTLVLVYTGASLPLLLLFINNPRPFSEVINYEIIADEIVRTLVGSIGLMLAVPITTTIAAYIIRRYK